MIGTHQIERKLDENRHLYQELLSSQRIIAQIRADLSYVHSVLNAERSDRAKEQLEAAEERERFSTEGRRYAATRARIEAALSILPQLIKVAAGVAEPLSREATAWRVASVGELALLSDEDFIRQIYPIFLGRSASESEFANALTFLEAGGWRLSVIAELRASTEGVAINAELPGLQDALARHRRSARSKSDPDSPVAGPELIKIGAALQRLTHQSEVRNTREAMLAEQLARASDAVALLQSALQPDWYRLVIRLVGSQSDSNDAALIRRELSAFLGAVAPENVESYLPDRPLDGIVAVDTVPDLEGDSRPLLVGLDIKTGGFSLDRIDRLNARFTGIGCQTDFARKVLIDAGVGVPVVTIGFGGDACDRPAAKIDTRQSEGIFRFLHIARDLHEDGTDLLLDAFGGAFEQDRRVHLIIACSDKIASQIQDRIGRSGDGSPRVERVSIPPSDAALMDLVGTCHAAVFPARTGGFKTDFSRVVRAGLPAVATAWGGHLDYCDGENGWLVDYEFVRSPSPVDGTQSFRVEPSLEALTAALKTAAMAPPAERARRGQSGRQRMIRNFSWPQIAERLMHLGRRAVEEAAADSLRIGWVSTWNIKCGIATNLLHQLEAFPSRNSVVLAPRGDVPLGPEDPFCYRVWSRGKGSNDFQELIDTVRRLELSVVVIHFNYGFYNHRELADLITTLDGSGVIVMMILHSTVDPNDDANYRLTGMLPGLERCKRIFVHGVADMNRLKHLQLVDNVVLLPHGVRIHRDQISEVRDVPEVPTLVSFGFCLPNKGLVELVEAVSLLRARGRTVKLLMLNAEYPDPVSAIEADKVRDAVARFALGDVIDFQTEFRDDEACLDAISRADLFVNPYQKSGESASGAVRFGLGAGRPVAVTPLPIFDDLGEAVFRMPGTSPADLADGLNQVLDHLTRRSERAAEVRKAADQWLGVHDFGRQGDRIHRIARSLRSDAVWKQRERGDPA